MNTQPFSLGSLIYASNNTTIWVNTARSDYSVVTSVRKDELMMVIGFGREQEMSYVRVMTSRGVGWVYLTATLERVL